MLILILLVPLLSTPAISAAQTQNVLICQGKVKLFSPYNRTYTPTESLHLDAALDIRYGPSNVYAANYTIDDGPLIKVSKDNIRDEFWSVSYGGIYVDVDLPKLPIGQHKLTIYISSDYPNGTPPYVVSGEATVYFTVSTTKTQDTPTTGGEINIYSPCNISYSPKSVIPIEASASTMGQNLTYTATYCVDGQGLYILRTKSFQTYQYDLFFGSMTATGELYFLPEGQHNVTVYMRACRANSEIPTITSEATVYFRVGDTKPPNITLCEIDGEVFNQNSVPLNFTINEAASWLGYSLDNSTQITITANTTLTIPVGNHTLTVYAKDTYGNMGQSEMAHFTVLINPTESPTYDVVLVAYAILVIAGASAFFVVFKRKQNRNH